MARSKSAGTQRTAACAPHLIASDSPTSDYRLAELVDLARATGAALGTLELWSCLQELQAYRRSFPPLLAAAREALGSVALGGCSAAARTMLADAVDHAVHQVLAPWPDVLPIVLEDHTRIECASCGKRMGRDSRSRRLVCAGGCPASPVGP
jgi:hypothetical protein